MSQPRELSRRERTRDKLHAAAVSAFAQRGFHATTTRDIASLAGVSSAAMYGHYASKEELLFQVSLEGHQEVVEVLTAAVAGSEDPVTQLRAVVRAYVLHHARKNDAARIVNHELSALWPDHLAEIQGYRNQIHGIFTDLVERGLATGLFGSTQPRMAIVALQSLGIDIARWYRPDGWSPEELADGYVDLAMGMLGVTVAPAGDGEQNRVAAKGAELGAEH